MVKFKLKKYIISLIIVFSTSACKKESIFFTFDRSKKIELTNTADNKSDKYCFKIVQNILKAGLVNKNETDSYYFRIMKDELLQNSIIKEKDYFKSIEKFYQDTFFSESYILEKHNIQYLILIGQSHGATGIGVDYWNYECYILSDGNKIIRFSSLAKTPYSVLFDNEKLRYIKVDDNYPRPASGILSLNYYPVIGSLYSENGGLLKQIEYDCKKHVKTGN
ncbi:hypothetical protein D0817_14940 [Flavobacterium cupreum]|uniref:Lipoprotein n=1 Tax=Flavobacterium cupreum TaxID=2133766 RepID=A0A434A551_9FLAO|nr:hypothetical protein [Flavobacterium cupreum]RUT69476.1 hypothetical protein D0817_14940 [Flavobacterium cupreum]